ncbi:MAG: hypothetical protein ACR2RL_14485 [Gammaproteobacteria bacterium]
MTKLEVAEIALIPAVVSGVWACAARLPGQVGVGQLLLGACALLLLQSLVRDLYLLRAARALAATAPPRVAQCMCLESTIGAFGILLGALVTVSGFSHRLEMGPLTWAGLVFVVLAVGFSIKDLVISWRPWRLLREKDHLNLIVSLRG